MDIWNIQKPSVLVNSPQSSASFGKDSFVFWEIFYFSDLLDKMALSTNFEDKLEGIENFWAWKYRIGLILRENDLDKYIKGEVSELEEHEAKENHKKDLIRAMGTIVDSVKDHLIPQVSYK